MPVAAPASVEPGRRKQCYASEEAYVYALAEALQVEYATPSSRPAPRSRSTMPGSRHVAPHAAEIDHVAHGNVGRGEAYRPCWYRSASGEAAALLTRRTSTTIAGGAGR
jgi:hypothetical protein